MKTESISQRDRLRGCLETLSSGIIQIQYQSSVPIAYVPDEIICQFFDDFYHPKSPEFLQAFSEEEIKEIGIFSGYLDIASTTVDMSGRPAVADLLKNPQWRDMMKKASTLLEVINKTG